MISQTKEALKECLGVVWRLLKYLVLWIVSIISKRIALSPSYLSTAKTFRPLRDTAPKGPVSPDGAKDIYKKLQSRSSTRLLRFVDNSDSNDISCALSEVSLESLDDVPPAFTALSYCWGEQNRTEILHCNGESLLITATLKAALQALKASPARSTQFLWIDQICINQDDVVEKTVQIQLMDTIYLEADQTIIWLGPEEGHEAQQAFDIIQKISPVVERVWNGGKPACHEYEAFSKERNAAIGLPPIGDSKWDGFWSILDRAWFRRTWIIQEIKISTIPRLQDDWGSPVVLCGELSCSWADLCWVYFWASRKGYPRTRLEDRRLEPVNNLFWLTHHDWSWDLEALLVMFKGSAAGDPRDKIFALTNLIPEKRENENPGRTLPPLIAPNYRKSVREAYVDAALHCIIANRSIDYLVSVEHPAEEDFIPTNQLDDQSYPSWVPRWHMCKQLPAANFGYAQHPRKGQIVGYPNCRASGGYETQVHGCSFDKNIIFARAVKVAGKVVEVSGTFDFKLIDIGLSGKHTSPIPAVWLSLMLRLVGLRRSPQTLLAEFQEVTTGNQDGLDKAGWGLIAYLSLCSVSFAGIEQVGSMIPGGRESFERALGDEAVVLERASRYSNALERLHNRKLFVTSDGYLGMGPSTIQMGDDIVVAWGASFPFVVRTEAEHCRFVGHSYVHGLMNGEAMDMWKKDEVTDEWLEIW